MGKKVGQGGFKRKGFFKRILLKEKDFFKRKGLLQTRNFFG